MVPCRGQVCRVYALLAGGHERGPCISGQTLRLFNSTNLVIEYVGRVHPELSCGSRIRRDAQVHRAHIAPRTSTPRPLEGDHNAHRRGTRCPSRPVFSMANCAGEVRRRRIDRRSGRDAREPRAASPRLLPRSVQVEWRRTPVDCEGRAGVGGARSDARANSRRYHAVGRWLEGVRVFASGGVRGGVRSRGVCGAVDNAFPGVILSGSYSVAAQLPVVGRAAEKCRKSI